MSRLYIKNTTDRSKTGKRAHETATTSIYWGSVGDSKLAASIEVRYLKDSTAPTVLVTIGDKVYRHNVHTG